MAGDEREPVGIDGWLAFFFVNLAALILRYAWGLLALFLSRDTGFELVGGGWMDLEIGEMVLTILAIGLCCIMAVRLYNERRWESVRLVIAGLWVLLVGKTGLEALLYDWAGFAVIDSGIAKLWLIGGIAYAALWTAYFLTSRRIANTYPREEEEDAIADT